jgi:uncharacterized protein (TIGR03437 family)
MVDCLNVEVFWAEQWISFTSATSGVGDAQITFNIAPTSVARSGQVRIGGRILTVYQEFDPCGAVTFRNARTITIPANQIPGRFAVDLAGGDLTGDGVDDLALIAKSPIGLLRIIPGNSLGGFEPARDVDLKLGSVFNPASATALVLADLNGDARQDLIVSSNLDGGSISSLLNQGNGVFSEPIVSRVGASASKIVARDLNNDQKTDLALISELTSNVTILLGNGQGSFVSNGNFGENVQSPAPRTLAAGDFNNDGKIDLVSGGQGAATLFLGDGMGRFGTYNRIAPTLSIYTFAAGDFNNDGRPDLAFSHSQQGYGEMIAILTGKGDGTFNQSPNIDIDGSATEVVAADMTGDGKQDLVIVDQVNRYVGVLAGNGDGSFRPATFYSSIERAGTPVIGDFNHDGRPDLVTSEVFSSFLPTEIRLSLLYRTSGGGLLTSRSFPLSAYAESIVSGDFNEDGRLDLAIGHSIAGSGLGVLTLLDGNASGEFDSPRTINLPSNIELRDVIDINHDGHLDLLALNYSAANVTILLGNGRGGFPFSAFQSVSQPLTDIALADFNRDGNLDLIAPAANNSLSIALGLGTGEFGAPVIFAPSIFNHRYAAGDFNGDGRMDLATATGGFCNPNNEITIFYGDGLGGFPTKTRFATGTFQPDFMLARDLNGDGRAELLSNNSCTPNQLLIFPTDGMGRLLEPAIYTLESPIFRLRTADLNSDGRLDILALQTSSSELSTMSALYSKSTGGYTNPAQIVTGSSIQSLATGDFNRDGRNDIVFGNSSGNLTLLLNSCQAAAQFTSVSAANFSGPRLARESIAAGFGNNLSTATAVASTVPLPTQLAGASVQIQDSAGSIHFAPLFFVSPNQINYLIPAVTSLGPAVVQVIRNDQVVASETIQITNGSPALFSVTQDGRGLAAAQILRVRGDGSQSYEPVAQFDPAQNAFVPVPIDLGPATDQVYLLLYGTGFRYAPSGTATVVTSVANVGQQYIGPQGSFVGLDQVNVLLPRFLIGSGEITVSLQTELGQSNTVKLRVK